MKELYAEVVLNKDELVESESNRIELEYYKISKKASKEQSNLYGVEIVKKEYLENKSLEEKENIDFCIVNAENVAEGMGITEKAFQTLLKMKVDCITMGNHTWGKKDIFNFIDNPKLIRPANYSKNNPGKGYQIFHCKDKRIAVINLIGRVTMNVLSENPFTVAEDIIEKIKNNVDIIIIDFHAEATAEKIALAYF